MIRFALSIASLLLAAGALAQHEGHQPAPTPTPTPAGPTETGHDRHSTAPAEVHGAASDRALFQSDMALMTGMTPKDPMAGMTGPGWHVMDLGIGRLLYNRQDGPSGASVLESSNWNMVHVGRGLGGGRLSLMLMNSLEPWTFEKRGSPELFQTGESYGGEPLVDRQHPHDFFMNVSATYRAPAGPESAYWIQVAPVGEPALGPTAFMHRASSGENPTAPLGHHWQDSTHITFNVMTAGFGWRWLSVEGSAFHGGEPDEDRWDIEGGAIDSASGRVRLTFPGGWSAQASHGYLHEPEQLFPGNLRRTTLSLNYGAEGGRSLAGMFLWGRNDEEHGVTDSYLLEGAWQATRADHVFGRLEYVEKDPVLLETKEHPHEEEPGAQPVVGVGALTLGYLRDFLISDRFRAGLGGDLTVYGYPRRLERAYGDFPVSAHVFLRLRWGSPHGGGGMPEGHEMTH